MSSMWEVDPETKVKVRTLAVPILPASIIESQKLTPDP